MTSKSSPASQSTTLQCGVATAAMAKPKANQVAMRPARAAKRALRPTSMAALEQQSKHAMRRRE
jgi:hypothetical protein